MKHLGKLVVILSILTGLTAIQGCDWNEDTSIVHEYNE